MKVKLSLGAFLTGILIGVLILLPMFTNDQTAPDVTFKTLDNTSVKLSDLHGQPVIVTFWASDCRACMEEIPHLIKLFDDYKDRGLRIFAVAMYYDIPSHVVSLREIYRLPYEIVLDLTGQYSQAFGDIKLTPTTFLISPEGRIVIKKVGKFEMKTMQEALDRLLSQPPENKS